MGGGLNKGILFCVFFIFANSKTDIYEEIINIKYYNSFGT